MKKPTMTVEVDLTDQVNDIIKQFKGDLVLVGVPEKKTSRQGGKETISNAALLAINEFGSPASGIPARPVLKMGINDAQEKITAEFKKAATNLLSLKSDALDTYLNRVGIIASTSVKNVINEQGGEKDGPIEGPADSTLKNRKRRGFLGEKSLILTGQLRNSITYVVP